MGMVYQWRKQSRFPVDAQVAAGRLQLIREELGEITPRAVVDDARGDNSPLHSCFDWDDATAAEAHRVHTARQLIGSLMVVSVDSKPVHRETRAFVHITADASPRYEPIEVAIRNVDMREEILRQGRLEIKRWRERYAAYEEFVEEFSEVFASVDAHLARTGASALAGQAPAGLGVAGRG